jgi:Flp pilus assembly protein CpaB
MLDNAESILYKKVLEGSTPELLFFLKTQGKRRGYVERSEVTGADGDAIPVAFVDYRHGLKSSDDSTDA